MPFLFLLTLIPQHSNVKFPNELEPNFSLSFLDIKISRSNGCFSTSVYHETTFTGLFTNLEFLYCTRTALFFPLLYRCFKLCLQYAAIHSELQKLKNAFKSFTPLRKSSTAPKLAVYLSLSFTVIHYLQIQTQLLKLFSCAYLQINFRFMFRPVRCLSNFLLFKDRVPNGLRSHVLFVEVSMLRYVVCRRILSTHPYAYLWLHGNFGLDMKETL